MEAVVPVAQGAAQWRAVGTFGLCKMQTDSRQAQIIELIKKDSALLNQ